MTARAKRAGYFWPRLLTQAIGSRLVRRPRRRRNQPSRPPPAKTRPNNPALLWRSSITALQVCVDTVSIVCNRCCSFRDPSKAGLIAVRAIPPGGTDDADGADGIFCARAHPDHPRPHSAFTREGNLDPERPQERLRPPQPAGERPRVFCPKRAPRVASTLRA
jgi:hypothetical protein